MSYLYKNNNYWSSFSQKEKHACYVCIHVFLKILAEDPASWCEQQGAIEQNTFQRNKDLSIQAKREMFGDMSHEELVNMYPDYHPTKDVIRYMSLENKKKFFDFLVGLYRLSPNARYNRRTTIYLWCQEANYNLHEQLEY